MRLADLYATVPPERHTAILVLGDRVYFDGDEYRMDPSGELHLVHSHREILHLLRAIAQALGVTV